MMLLALAILGGLFWLYLAKIIMIRDLKEEIVALEVRKTKLLSRAEELAYLLAHAEDREMIELQAREKLLYGYPGEVLVLLKE